MTNKEMLSAAAQTASEHVSGGRVHTVAVFTDKRYNVLSVAGNTYVKTHPQQALWSKEVNSGLAKNKNSKKAVEKLFTINTNRYNK